MDASRAGLLTARVGHPADGPPRPGPPPQRGHRGHRPPGRGAVRPARPGPAALRVPDPTPSPTADGRRSTDDAVDGLLQAYAELLPAVNTLVGHHFTRTLVRVALDHVERRARTGSARRSGTASAPTGPPAPTLPGCVDATAGEARPMTGTPRPPRTGRTAVRRPRVGISLEAGRPGPRRPTSPPGPRRPSSSARCSTPSPPATTWSTGR